MAAEFPADRSGAKRASPDAASFDLKERGRGKCAAESERQRERASEAEGERARTERRMRREGGSGGMKKASDWEAKADALFENKSIADIQTIEAKLRYAAVHSRAKTAECGTGEKGKGREKRERVCVCGK